MTMLADERQTRLAPAAAEQLSAELGEPAWALEARRAALAAWDEIAYPKGTDEAWRRTDPERFRPEGRTAVSVQPTFDSLGEAGGDDEVLAASLAGVLADDAYARQVLEARPDEKFPSLSAAWRGGGVRVAVPAGRQVVSPIRALHHVPDVGGPAAWASASVVTGGANSQSTVVEYFESTDSDLLAVPEIHIRLDEGARMQYVLVARWGKGTRAVARFRSHLAKDAQLRVLVLGIGGSISKTVMTGDLEGEGSKSEMLSLVFANGRQHFDADTLHNHLVPNTMSDVLFNVALNDRSRSVFAGNIYVAPGAQKTDAYQKNRNLLLSDKARADSMPKLEIVANDVRCTHGATFTTYDLDQRFYLQSRGLKDADARRLIITGFFQEVIERLEGQVLIDWLADLMQQKMEAALGE